MRTTAFVLALAAILLSAVALAGEAVAPSVRTQHPGLDKVQPGESLDSKVNVPRLISYQGTLTDAAGVALDTTVTITFSIYADSAGGLALWAEIQSIVVASGVFNVLLGRIATIPVDIFSDPERWLGVRVGVDPELEPRQRIAAVGYAFWAAEADTAEYARSAPAAGVDSVMYADSSGYADVAGEAPMPDSVVHAVYADTADQAIQAGSAVVADYADSAARAAYADSAGTDSDWILSGNNMYSAVPGSVGIGTSSPTNKLHVSGGLYVATGAQIDSGLTVGWIDGDPDLRFYADGGPRLVIETTGNIGIGKSSPSARLDVDGDINADSLYKISGETVLSTQGDEVLYIGPGAGANSSGNQLVFVGDSTGYGNQGWENTFVGSRAGYSSGLGSDNTFVGANAGYRNDFGEHNTFVGSAAGCSTISSANNVFVGSQAGRLNRYGYSNVFVGYEAGEENTNGGANTFLGTFAGQDNTTGGTNTFLGVSAGMHNTIGGNNTCVGEFAGYLSTEGDFNVCIGSYAGAANPAADSCVFIGPKAGYWEQSSNRLYIANDKDTSSVLIYGEFDNRRVGLGTLTPEERLHVAGDVKVDSTLQTVGFKMPTGASIGYVLTSDGSGTGTWQAAGADSDWIISGDDIYAAVTGNVGVGKSSPAAKLDVAGMVSTDSAYQIEGKTVLLVDNKENVFVGKDAGKNSTSVYENTFVGARAGSTNTEGDYNAFFGSNAGRSNTTGEDNTFIGCDAGVFNTEGYDNTFLGEGAGYINTTGDNNTFVGDDAGGSNSTGSYNIFVGSEAGIFHTQGDGNIFIGNNTGRNNVTGAGNVFLGLAAGYHEAGSNKLYIANGFDTSAVLIYGEFDNGRVGLGTLTPEERLHVAGDVKVDSTLQTVGFKMPTGASNGYVLTSDGSGAGTWQTPAAVYDGDWTISGSDIYSAVSGNVGIGTSSPGQKLHIVGANPRILVEASSASPEIDFMSTGDPASEVWAIYKHVGTDDLHFYQVGEKLTIKNGTGDVGIGKTSPGAKLDVAGEVNSDSVYQIGGGTVLSAEGSFNINVGIGAGKNNVGSFNAFFGANAGSTNTIGNNNTFVGCRAGRLNAMGEYNTFVGHDAGEYNTASYNTFVGYAAGMDNTIGQGNVFIGREAGFANISGLANTFLGDVTGRNKTTGDGNVLLGAGAGLFNAAGDSNVFIGYEAGYNETGSNKLYIANGQDTSAVLIYGEFDNGRIGLGTLAPTERLHVAGDVKVDSTLQTVGFKMPTGASNGYVLTSDGSGAGTWQAASMSDGDWTISGSDIYSAVSGNVGIGASSPAYKLHVLGANPRILVEASAGSPEVNFKSTGDPASDVWAVYKHVDTDDLHFYQGGDKLTLQDSTGNVGIGTTSPGERLDVAGTAQVIGFKMPTGASNGYVLTSDGSGAGTWQTASMSDGDWTISGSDMYAAVSRWVGIGTSSPASKLHIKETGFPAELTIESTEDYSPQLIFSNDDARQWRMWYDPTDSLLAFYREYVGEKMVITNDGDVGIGTTSPSEQLDVAGTAKVTGFKMATGASDGYILTTDAAGMASWQPTTAVTETVVTLEMHSEGNVIVDSVLFAGTISSLSPLELQAPEGQTRVFISDSTGNVGINKMNPAARLDVNGEINTNSTYQIGGQRVFAVDDSFNTFVGSGTGTLYSGMYGTFVGCRAGSTNTGGRNTFIGHKAGCKTGSGAGNVFLGNMAGYNETGSNKLLIANGPDTSDVLLSGNFALGMVGIGTVNPTQKLHVSGASNPRVLIEGSMPELNFKDGSDLYQMFLVDDDLWFYKDAFNVAFTGGGRVGIGTSSPSQLLHVKGTSNPRVLIEGSTPELNLKNGSNTYQLYMVDDDLWFYKDAFNVAFTGDGKVGIGTYSPDAKLTVEGPTNGMVLAKINQTGGRQYVGLRLDRNDTEKWFVGMDLVKDHLIFRRSASSNDMAIDTLGNVGIGVENPPRKLWVNGDAGGTSAWYNDSDRRLKKNITRIDDALEKVNRLEGVCFEWEDTENHPEGLQLGMIAQRVNEVVPEVVERKGEYYSMATANLVPLLVEAIKEQQEQIEELRAQLEALR